MKTLALETVGKIGSLAVFHKSELLASHALDAELRTAQSLTPALVQVCAKVGWQMAELDLISVAIGPGSFTGLRIGVTTAKTLAFAVDAKIIGVGTLQTIAVMGEDDFDSRWAVLDAGRGELYAARFARREGQLVALDETQIISHDAWIGMLNEGDEVSGPPLATCADRLPAGVVLRDASLWQPKAESVGRLAFQKIAAGKRDDVFELLPRYYRRSAAEEKLAAKRAAGETP